MIIPGNDPRIQPSFSVANRSARALWQLMWILMFRFSPRPLHAWRRLILLAFGAKVGQGCRVYPRVRVWAPWQLELGERVLIGDGVDLYNMAPISIGDECIISQGAHLCGGSHDIDSPNFQLIARPITLGCNVWICAEAFVGLGVCIADGCVIGARSVLTRSVDEPWSVWTGNPARKKRMRERGKSQ
jgi:putative colanic acid biosynthesis acetyltransferase WcaF